METYEILKLKFRRQYIIAPRHIDCPFENKQFKINDSHILYSHIDLLVSIKDSKNFKLILLGDLFDYEQPEKNNSEILDDLVDLEFNLLLERIAKYTGRYLIIHIEGQKVRLVNDCHGCS